MNWLRDLMLRWLGFHQPSVAAKSNDGGALLSILSHSESAGVLTVLPIRNGFLICARTFNPNGPDKIDAVYTASADELGPLLVAEMATRRLTK